MKRRQLLCGMLGFAAWPALASVFDRTAEGIVDSVHELADCLLRACPRRPSLVAVGNARLQSSRSSLTVTEAVDHLVGKLKASPSDIRAMSPSDLKSRLRSQMSNDFGAGRTIQVDGWILSETETGLCSLAALHSGRHTG